MSWLPNPFKSLQLYDDDDPSSDTGDAAGPTAGGVKEDLSVIGQTIGRQLRGVAAFLAPPPASSPTAASPSSADAGEEPVDPLSPALAKIRSDLAEIGGSFKSSLSLLSNTKTVAEFSKMASNFLHLDEEVEEDEGEEEEEDDRGVGVTDAVVRFVTEISERPECWTDFPLSLNHDFNMSDAQAEHASVIEQLVPSLSELRASISDSMSASQFWMIYFILLLPRLNRDSVDLLSTPEIVEARSTLLTMMLNKRDSPSPDSHKDEIKDSSHSDGGFDQDRHDPSSSGEKAVIPDTLESSKEVETKQTAGKSLEERETSAASTDARGKFKSEDDFSFSDLEDEETDLSTRRYSSGRGQDAVSSSPDGPNEWVQLNKNAEIGGGRSRGSRPSSQNRDSEGEDSSDWLNIDEFDHDG